jgi:hypothetical protein
LRQNRTFIADELDDWLWSGAANRTALFGGSVGKMACPKAATRYEPADLLRDAHSPAASQAKLVDSGRSAFGQAPTVSRRWFIRKGRALERLPVVEKRPTALECRKEGSDRSFSIGPKAFPPNQRALHRPAYSCREGRDLEGLYGVQSRCSTTCCASATRFAVWDRLNRISDLVRCSPKNGDK